MNKRNHRALLLFLFGVMSCPAWGQTSGLPLRSAAGTNRLLVIAPNRLHPVLQEYVAHKRTLLPTELCSLEEILQATQGADDPEKLKRFLYEEWRQHGLGYVLLVGDVDVLPVRYMVLDRIPPAACDYAFYPCDLDYIGCNTGSQPCGLTLVEGFVTALAEGEEPRLGDVWARAIRHYFDQQHLPNLKPNADWYPPSIFFQGMKFMLFGDPSLRLPGNHR